MDRGNQGRNEKPLSVVMWIIPIVSCMASGVTYAVALDAVFSPVRLVVVVMGLMFACIGNYLPKCRQNATIGIKVPWVYTSEANWDATHRFGGRLWFASGLLLALGGFLPRPWGGWLVSVTLGVNCVVPVVYSYRYYRMQKARGDELLPLFRGNLAVNRKNYVVLAAILAGVAVLLFSGDIDVVFGETGFTIEASFYSDLTVDYAVVKSVEHRAGNVDGVRTSGYGSFRLLMGYFANEEFGSYTRYTYYCPESCVVLRTVEDRTLVLSGKNAAETEVIYQKLLENAAL